MGLQLAESECITTFGVIAHLESSYVPGRLIIWFRPVTAGAFALSAGELIGAWQWHQQPIDRAMIDQRWERHHILRAFGRSELAAFMGSVCARRI